MRQQRISVTVKVQPGTYRRARVWAAECESTVSNIVQRILERLPSYHPWTDFDPDNPDHYVEMLVPPRR